MGERLERGGPTARDLCPDDKCGADRALTDKGRSRLVTGQPDHDAAVTVALKEHGCEDLLASTLIRTRQGPPEDIRVFMVLETCPKHADGPREAGRLRAVRARKGCDHRPQGRGPPAAGRCVLP